MANTWISYFNTTDKSTESVATPAELPALLANRKGFYWLDIMDTNPDNLEGILKTLGINASWNNYFGRPEILPHVKDTPWLLSFYLYDVLGSETLLDSAKAIKQINHAPVLVFMGERFIITYRQTELDLLAFAKIDCAENFKLSGKTPAFVAFLLLQHSMYHVARLNLANDNFLDRIECNVLSHNPAEYKTEISIAGSNILTLKKLNANLHIILLVIVTKNSYVIGDEARVYFKHMLENSEGIRASIDSSRDLLDSIIVGMHAESARKTGEVMRVLTIISAIFMPMALIAGVYGMNFQFMPELSWHYGYYMSLGLMAAVSTVFLSVFYYFGWIGRKKHKK